MFLYALANDQVLLVHTPPGAEVPQHFLQKESIIDLKISLLGKIFYG